MVEVSKSPRDKFKQICSSIDKLDKETWETVQDELINQKGLSQKMCDEIHKFIVLKGSPLEIMKIIEEKKLFEGSKIGTEALEEMRLLFGYL